MPRSLSWVLGLISKAHHLDSVDKDDFNLVRQVVSQALGAVPTYVSVLPKKAERQSLRLSDRGGFDYEAREGPRASCVLEGRHGMMPPAWAAPAEDLASAANEQPAIAVGEHPLGVVGEHPEHQKAAAAPDALHIPNTHLGIVGEDQEHPAVASTSRPARKKPTRSGLFHPVDVSGEHPEGFVGGTLSENSQKNIQGASLEIQKRTSENTPKASQSKNEVQKASLERMQAILCGLVHPEVVVGEHPEGVVGGTLLVNSQKIIQKESSEIQKRTSENSQNVSFNGNSKQEVQKASLERMKPILERAEPLLKKASKGIAVFVLFITALELLLNALVMFFANIPVNEQARETLLAIFASVNAVQKGIMMKLDLNVKLKTFDTAAKEIASLSFLVQNALLELNAGGDKLDDGIFDEVKADFRRLVEKHGSFLNSASSAPLSVA